MYTLFQSVRCASCLRKLRITKFNFRNFSRSPIFCEAILEPAALPQNFIPEPPPLPNLLEPATPVINELNVLGEPTLQSLGLASWWPNGLIQSGLEHIHVGLDIPWWTSIVIGTIILRILTFPLVVFTQRNAARQHNTMPIIQHHQSKFNEAQRSGDILEASKHANALIAFTKEHNISPLKSALTPFLQMPIFISVFIGLRQMANLPVESMTSGGIAWFMDLTSADPYFLLPIITTVTLLTTLEIGVDTVRAKSLSPIAKTVMRCLPIVLFPFMMNFPACLLVYWCSSNFFSLLQVSILRFEAVKRRLKIPKYIQHDPAILPEKKPMMKSIRESMDQSKKIISVEERMRQEAIRFKEAGMGAIKKTYDYDPTKVQKKINAD